MKEFKYFLDSNIFLRPIIRDDLKKVKEKEMAIISYDKDFDKLNIKRKEPKEALKATQ